jgi:5'(3')-deoxyribonucleotidase
MKDLITNSMEHTPSETKSPIWSRNALPSMEPKGSLLCSQKCIVKVLITNQNSIHKETMSKKKLYIYKYQEMLATISST